MILTKSIGGGLKDLDTDSRTVKIAIAGIGNLDAYNDIIHSGAFKKSVKENGPKGKGRIKHFKNHFFGDVPGVFQELYEEGEHLIAVSKIVNTTLGNDTMVEYEQGVITEHSIGFEIVKQEPEKDSDGKTVANHIKEIFLWEGSSLTAWGANSNTPYLGAKDLQIKMDELERLMTTQGFSDERYKAIETSLNELKEVVTALSQGFEPLLKSTQPKEPQIADVLKAIREA